MKIWLVWEDVNDYPESGGGIYLDDIFLEEEDAKAYCEERNEIVKDVENTSFYVQFWEAK